MDWLRELLKKQGLDDAKIDAIVGEAGKELPKHFVPKSQYNDASEAKKQAEQDRDKVSSQLEELKKSAGDNQALKDQITKLQGENKTAKDEYDAKVKDLQLTTAIKLALTGQAHDLDIVAGLLDKTKIELDDTGTVKGGLDDQVKALRESRGFLFVPEDGNKPRFKGAKPPEGGDPGGNGGEASTGAGFAQAANESGKAPAAALNPWG
ncbi:phage scaffolding protein [Paenibacillus sp. FSL K6-1230]|uniref:phage scaffolding protein n=1 Tax=Paenibacillus sp. FSL K6-1230 TaxID=2921603 RepID=UPI0030F5C78E